MIRGNRILAGFVLALLVVGALSGAAAIADEGVDEGAQQNEAPGEDAGLQLLEVAGEEPDTSPPAEGELVETSPPSEADPSVDRGDDESADGGDARPRPAARGRTVAVAASALAQPDQEGQGQVEIDPESAAGLCPGGTALKIDGLRSNGTFGPITISDYTNTSFTWTSTEAVSAVLVKDGGGHKTNPGGSSGSASTFGQDISHVIFCLGGDVPEVDAETPEDEEPCDGDETMPGTQPCEPAPCDADETMPGTQPCEPAPCDADETMPGTQPCEPAPCDADETMPGTQPCVPAPCDADETMPGTQPCVPAHCDADDTMPGRQDCTEGVAGVESDPKKSQGDDGEVQGAGLAADDEPHVAPMAAQAAQPAVEGVALPFTGAGVFPLLMVALGLVYAGGGALLIRRP
jgi:hypothetical protein